MIDLATARRHVLDRVEAVAAAPVAVVDVAGLVLAEDVIAANPVPPFDNTAMDGVAVRSADLAGAAGDAPVRLRLVGTVAAGSASAVAVGHGEAMRIMTGAPVPPGADAVVMVELCRFETDAAVESVVVSDSVPAGNHIRPVGDDVATGEVVLRSGDRMTPGAVGMLRTLGLDTVRVLPRPRVGVMSTGDELVEPPGPLGPGQIFDSNRAALLALVAEAGCEPVDLGLVRDDDAAIEAALRAGADTCDAVLTSGGVSMGDFDLVRRVLDRIGDMRWMQIGIRPAKPFAFGLIAGSGTASGAAPTVPVFGLPGNPVSSMVSFELLARPALRKMAGRVPWVRPATTALAGEGFGRRADGKVHFVRVVVTAGEAGAAPTARSAGAQGSHQLGAMAVANGFAVLADGEGVPAGGSLDVLLFDELRPARPDRL